MHKPFSGTGKPLPYYLFDGPVAGEGLDPPANCGGFFEILCFLLEKNLLYYLSYEFVTIGRRRL